MPDDSHSPSAGAPAGRDRPGAPGQDAPAAPLPSSANRDGAGTTPAGGAPAVAAPGRDALGLESLGLLASGIAHDFNNILAAVRGNVGLAREALAGPRPDVTNALDDLTEVERAVERATALVRQLLAFGRRQARTPEPLDLNRLVREAAALLRVLVGDDARLTLRLAPDTPDVLADRSQLEQVLMNLVLNGRDAIADAGGAAEGGGGAGHHVGPAERRGGTLLIATDIESIAPGDVRRAGVPGPGPYVRLTVRDDGAGMDEKTRARIFEPFFTTKAPDRGTGLGLAAVWGIVRQTGGGIAVESAPGQGSAFSVYLPVAAPPRAPRVPDAALDGSAADGPAGDAAARADGPARRAPVFGAGNRTVLLAEDDHAVRRVAARILRNAGYRVLEAGDGRSALALWRAHAAEAHVLVSDVRMPQLRGDEVAAAVHAEAPEFPVVFMTGFAEEPTGLRTGDRMAARCVRVLPKPFAADELLARVGEVLDAAGAEAGVPEPEGVSGD